MALLCCNSMTTAMLVLCVFAVLGASTHAARAVPASCTGTVNTLPVHTAAPTFVKSVKNGKRYLGGSGNDTFHVVHLYSDTDDLYEMGYALGQLFPTEIADMFDKLEPWLEGKLEAAVPWLPKWLADVVIKYGAPFALDLVYDMTEKFTPEKYKREWQGIADGANCSVEVVRRVVLFPQASKAACTALVAHEKATAGGGVHHLRALDFDQTAPVADFASVVIYHYKSMPSLANFGWIAMSGVLSGMNSIPISAGEKAWGGGHDYPILKLPVGFPWMQMIRESLELTNLTAIDSFIKASNQATPTDPGNSVDIHLAYGDQRTNTAVGFEVGYNYSKQFGWNTHQAEPTHPLFEGIVYWSKNDPARTMCVADMLTGQYGKIDAEWLAMVYSPLDETGDTHMVAWDLEKMTAYFANNRKTGADGNIFAYNRQRTLLDMKALFAESQ